MQTSETASSSSPSPPPDFPRPSRLEIFGWCMFDFANSSYTTVIVTFAFGVYFADIVVPGAGLTPEDGDFLWGLSAAISQGLVLITAPLVGAIADFSGAKKKFLFLTFVGCVVATAGLWFVHPGDIALGMTLFVVSNIFYSSGENLAAAFLPELAQPKDMGKISGLGWSLGYLGGLGSLFACFPLLRAGFTAENAAGLRLSSVVVAAFFFLGGLPTFLFLRERAHPGALPSIGAYVTVGFRRVAATLRDVRRYRQLFRFLVVFLLYTCGINAIVAFANIYAKRVMGMSPGELLVFFCILQVSAALGALGFGFLQDRIGSKAAIHISLVIWLGVCVGAYFSPSVAWFYVIGNLAGIAMGSAQSGGRALTGVFSPVDRTGEFFGFWALFWKLSAMIGPLAFGTASKMLDMRWAILLTAGFFAAGIVGMFFIDEEEGQRAARGAEAAPKS